jgi:hypothetical protein
MSDSDDEGLGKWDPLSLAELGEVFTPATFRWWVAGGTAVDLFLGQVTRFHEDVDVEVLRADQIKLQRLLGAWDLHVAQDGRLRPWPSGEYLTEGDGSIWCRRNPDSPWVLQVLLGESDGEDWLFRRDPRVSIPIGLLGRRTRDGIPYLTPCVQLLFKARNTRPRDWADFEAVLPNLDPADRIWLISALAFADPGHPWLARLESAES